jgi:hypothetical protein
MGRIAKWALKLMGIDITYVPETAIKSQVLADFVAEWIETQQSPALVTQGRSTTLHDLTSFPHHKQCGRI